MLTFIIAGVVTFVFTTVLTIAGVGAAFILIPVFLALGVPLLTAMSTALLLNSIAMIFASRNATVQGGRRVRYDLAVFAAGTGQPLWRNTQTPVPDHILEGPHGEQVQHPAIVAEVIYGNGFACKLATGEPIDGWKWQKSGHCGTLSTSAACAFSRYDNPRMFDLKSGAPTVLTTATRSGCWINIIPAGGLILIPEASAGCTCGHAIQTSLALVPRGQRRP